MQKYVLFLFLSACTAVQVYSQDTADSLLTELSRLSGQNRVPVLLALVETHRINDTERAVSFGREALSILDNYPDDSLRNKSLYLLGSTYIISGQFDSTQYFARESISLSESLGDSSQFARGNLLLGESQFRQGDYQNALEKVFLSLGYFESMGDSVGVAMATLMVGNLHNNLGNYDLAIAYYDRGAAIRRARGENGILIQYTANIGVAYRRKGEYEKALGYYFEALEFFQESGNDPRIAATLTNLGVLHYFLGQLDESLEFHRRALDINEKLNRTASIATSLSNIGVILNEQGSYEEALNNFQLAKEIEQDIGDQEGVGDILNNMGLVYFNQGSFEQALTFYKQSLQIKRDIGNPEAITNTLHNLVDVNRELQNAPQALLDAQESLAISNEIGNLSLVRDSYLKLTDVHEELGNFEAALDAYKAYKSAQDSLFNTDSQSVIAELQTQYKTRENEQTIQILEQEKAIQRLWLAGLVGGIILTGLIAILGYNGYRIKKRALARLDHAHGKLVATQAQLIQQEKMASLGRISTGIAHEISNPLNFVNNFSRINSELLEEIDDDTLDNETLQNLKLNQNKIVEHGQRVEQIVRSMMAHAQNASGEREQVLINSLIEEYIKIAHSGLLSEYPNFEIEINRDYDDEAGRLFVSSRDIGKVIINLFQNAHEELRNYAIEKDDSFIPRISVSTCRKDDVVEIRLKDNGPGIPEHLKEKIFEPFFTTKQAGNGTGLGLSLSYDIITQGHNGQIKVEDSSKNGASFLVTLPVANLSI